MTPAGGPRLALLVAALLALGGAALARAEGASPLPAADRDSVRSALGRGDYRTAERDARRVIAAARDGGAAAPDSAEAMQLLAWAVFRLARHAEAESLARAAIAARERRGESFDLALALGTLADIRNGRGAPAEAESLCRRALAIAERAGPADELEVARMRQTLANTLMDGGDLDGAAAELTRVLELRRRRLGGENLVVAQTLHNLAIVRRRQGELTQARRLYEESLAIRERLLGEANVDVAWSLNNLANVLYELGEFAEVRRLHGRALAIREWLLGPDHPDVAFSLNNLGNTLQVLGDLDAARRMHERALAIRERVGGPMHVDVAQSLNNLGYVSALLGQRARADSLYRRSIAIRERALGMDHPQVAISLLRLAYLREAMGDTAEARALDARTLEIRRRRLGPDHYETALVHLHLADMSWRRGATGDALREALAAEDVSRRHFRRMVRGLDDRTALSFADERTSGLDLLLEMSASGRVPPVFDSLAADAVVRSRALVLDELAARRAAVAAAAGDTAVGSLARELAGRQALLAELVLRGPKRGDADAFAAELAREDRATAATQRALAERSAVHRRLGNAEDAGLEAGRRALPAGTALVSIARYSPLAPPGPDRAAAPERYVAFVTRPETPRVTCVPLGAAAGLDSLVHRWIALAGRAPSPLRRAADERACREAGARVRERLWDPLARELPGVERVLVVPDGAVAFVPWAALPLRDGRRLVESDVVLHQVAMERDVLDFARARDSGSGLLAFGGVDYGARGAPPGAGRSRGEGTDSTARGTPCTSLAELRFAALPGSAAEVEAIHALWTGSGEAGGAAVRTGAAADERALRELAPGRRVLHLATHGFFLERACAAAGDEHGDPLCRSGIVLAGAGATGADSGRADGIVTAAEIAGFDLSGVEWAVLSACRTGLGDLEANEGVLGLRRALRIAGVSTVITSLWEVDDQAVRAWMQELYRARLERGLDTAAAMRAAARTVLQARRAAGLGDHPREWAAFVAAGDWR